MSTDPLSLDTPPEIRDFKLIQRDLQVAIRAGDVDAQRRFADEIRSYGQRTADKRTPYQRAQDAERENAKQELRDAVDNYQRMECWQGAKATKDVALDRAHKRIERAEEVCRNCGVDPSKL